LLPGADRTAVDKRIWDLFGERWAIMYTDLSGFSRRVAEFGHHPFPADDPRVVPVARPVIDRRSGFLLKVEGDSMMVIFRNVDEAVGCAIEMQRVSHAYNVSRAPQDQVLLCLGSATGRCCGSPKTTFRRGSERGEQAGRRYGEGGRDSRHRRGARRCNRSGGCSFVPIDFVPPGAKAAYSLVYPA
jgi:hypothetical protein